MVLPEAHASERKPVSSPGRSRFTDSLAPPRTQQSIPLKHHPHSTSKLDLGDHRSIMLVFGLRPSALTKNEPLLFLVTRFFFSRTSSHFRCPIAAATATFGASPNRFAALHRWVTFAEQTRVISRQRRGRGPCSLPSSLGGHAPTGPAVMDPSSPPLTVSRLARV